MKIIKSCCFYFTCLSFFFDGCKAQKVSKNIWRENVLIIEVAFKSNKQIGREPTAFALLDFSELDSFNFKDDSVKNSPNVIYNITYNGGFYISEAFTNIFTLGCCEYGRVENAVRENVNKKISKHELKDYDEVEKLSLKQFNDYIGCNYNFNIKGANYTITVWEAELNYCVCDLYMETPSQAIFGKKAAYIKGIFNIKKPKKNVEDKIFILLEKIISLDAKYQ